MTSHSHQLRRNLRRALRSGPAVVGIFIKLAVPDGVEAAQAAGFDFVVIDLEHSTLSESEAIALVRHADICRIAALVRLPALDPDLINRLLENGAVGFQLSMVRTVAQARALHSAVTFAPTGSRSFSMTNRVASSGRMTRPELLRAERADPPLLVAQIETASTEPLTELLLGLDVCFVGSSDLAVALEIPASDREFGAVVARIRAGAEAAGVAFGGWAPSRAEVPRLGLEGAGYVVVGSDLQLLLAGLHDANGSEVR